MDTATDFLFLNERIATGFNPFYNEEYLVIQTYPREIALKVELRSFYYKDANNYCHLQNLAHDYTSFGLRIFHDGHLWNINYEGKPQSISEQQDWRITE